MKLKLTDEMQKHLKTLTICELTKEGYELHNPIPIDVPVPIKSGDTLKMRIAALMRKNQHENSVESLEDSMDFDVGDDMVEPSDDTHYMVSDGPTELEQAAAAQGIPLNKPAAETEKPEPTVQKTELTNEKPNGQ